MPNDNRVSVSSNRYSIDEAVSSIVTSLTFRRVSRSFSFPSENLIINVINFDFPMSTIDGAHEQIMSSSCHAILTFIVSALLIFVGVKYQGKDNSPFETHPTTTTVAIVSVLGYGLAYGAELQSCPSLTTFVRVVRSVKMLLGSLILASVASILLPDLAQPLLYVVLILLVVGPEFYALALKLCRWVQQMIICSKLIARQAQQRLMTMIRPRPLLPLTTMDANTTLPI